MAHASGGLLELNQTPFEPSSNDPAGHTQTSFACYSAAVANAIEDYVFASQALPANLEQLASTEYIHSNYLVTSTHIVYLRVYYLRPQLRALQL